MAHVQHDPDNCILEILISRKIPNVSAYGVYKGDKNTMNKLAYIAIAATTSFLFLENSAFSATDSDTFTSQIIIQADCQIVSTNTLDFGTQGVLIANVDTTATFDVQCTNTTAYNLQLNQGTTVGGTVATRKMINGAATIDYRMYRDASHTLNWGVTNGTNTITGTGNGAAQTITIYGRVPIQTTPAAGIYTDTVTVTVEF